MTFVAKICIGRYDMFLFSKNYLINILPSKSSVENIKTTNKIGDVSSVIK